MKRWLTVSVVAAVVCLMAIPAMAQRRPGGERQGGPQRFNPTENLKTLVGKLDLNEEQKTKVAEVFKAAEEAQKAEREKNQPKMEELRKQMDEARKANDQDKVNKLMQEMRALFASGAETQKKTLEQVKAVLTPEQVTKLDQLLAEQQRARSRLLSDIALRNAETLKLTDEQKKQLEELSKAYREAAGKITGDDREKQTKELSDKLATDVKSLLNDEQKTALDKLQTERRGGDGERQPRTGGERTRQPRTGGEGNRQPRNGGTTTPPV